MSKINPDIDQKTLNVDYKIEAFIQMYEKESVEFIEDFYCKNRDLTFSLDEDSIVTDVIYEEKEIKISDTFNDILEDNVNIIESNLDTSNLNIVLDGNNIKISVPIDKYSKGNNVSARINDVALVVTQNGKNIDIKIVIKLDVSIESILNISSISNIEDGPLDLKDISSINIYVVKKGDTIWKIAKKYKTSMDNIIKTNNVENPNQILEGQKLLVIR